MAVAYDLDRPLPDVAQKDIEQLCMNAAALTATLRSLQGQPPEFSPSAKFTYISEQLGRPFAEVRKLFATLENLTELQTAYGPTIDVIVLVQKRLAPDRAKLLVEHGTSIRVLLALYAGNHPVAISVKAEKLSYLHEHLFQNAEVITDARPVFDASGENILEVVVGHSLALSYFSAGVGGRRIHLAMDATDVERLKEVCERAVLKAKTLRASLERTMTPTAILNERRTDV